MTCAGTGITRLNFCKVTCGVFLDREFSVQVGASGRESKS